ncbi:hypothetical protein [Shimia sediminis]|uniref:hypothetical protein n=1 Tax=Shimia sediminis TaxID=2497945 RepID=UPI000F8CE998|nr:hypothetical protein [Shimia sediminis]
MRQAKAIARFKLGIAKFHFIHIPKNAGMTYRNSREMRRRVLFSDPFFHVSKKYTQELFRVMAENGHHHGSQHARLRDINPKVRNSLTSVSIVRNPWSRAYSRFTFRYKYLEREGHDVDYSREAFEAFLEERHEFANRPFYWHRAIHGWYPQLDYIVDDTGNLACDVLRQEHLRDETLAYFGDIEIRDRNRSGLKAPPYHEIYTQETIQIVADWYKADVDAFGFDFDTPAQKNCVYTPDSARHGAPER